jgi:hypothetical protein
VDVGLQGVPGGLGWIVVPEVGDQPVDRDDRGTAQNQERD